MANQVNGNRVKQETPLLGLKRLLLSAVGGILAAVLLALIAAWIISRGDFDRELLQKVSYAISTAAGLLTGFLCARMAGRQGILNGLLAAAVLMLCFLMCGLLLHEKSGSEEWIDLLRLGLILAAGGFGGFLGVPFTKKR